MRLKYLNDVWGNPNELYLDENDYKELEKTFSFMDSILSPSEVEVKQAFDKDPIYEIMNWYASANSLYFPYGEFRFPNQYRWMETRLLDKKDTIWEKWIKYVGTRKVCLSN